MSQVLAESILYSGVTSTHENPRSSSGAEDFKWHRESVMLLISLYQAKKSQFTSGFVKKRDLWSEVATEMSLQGFSVNMIACEKKWHNLCATYRKLKDCSLKKRSCWQYFLPLQEALENNYSIQNLSVGGSCLLRNENNCGVVKIETTNMGEASTYGSNAWPPYHHSQVRNSPGEGESGSCDQDISNMLSVTIEENLERSQVSRDEHIATPSAYLHGGQDDFKWTHDSVMLLCSLYLARKEQFLSGAVKKRDLWTDIAQELNREGFSATCIACEKKWHNLIATYKKVTMYSRKKTWPYLRIFRKIVEEQEMRSAILSEQCNLSSNYSKNSPENTLKPRYFDKDEDLNSSRETVLFSENLNAGTDEFKWTHVSVISLCNLYQERRHEFFSNTVRKRDLWMEISNEMNSQGFNVTWVHCEKKWYNLYATYKKVIDQNRKRVRVWSTWPYLKLFQDIFNPNTEEPLEKSDVCIPNKCDIDSNIPSSVHSPISVAPEHCPDSLNLNNDYQKHSSKKQCMNYAPEWFLEYVRQQKEMEERRQQQCERHHQELIHAINIGNSALLELSSSLKSFFNKTV